MTSSGESDINPLWVCEECQLIGEEDEARRHGRAAGHTVECLTLRESDAVRGIWADQRAARIAAFITYGRLRRKVGNVA
jgi:hypothetical protein